MQLVKSVPLFNIIFSIYFQYANSSTQNRSSANTYLLKQYILALVIQGQWKQVLVSNDRASDKPHWLQYCHRAKLGTNQNFTIVDAQEMTKLLL